MSEEQTEITLKKERGGFVALVIFSVALIGCLVAMPFIFGKPDEEGASDFIKFLGRFHPVVLHLPIGVFALLVLQEGLAIVSRYKPQRSMVPILFGAGTSVLAVLFGFLLYQGGGFEGELIEDHLWGGIIFSSLTIVTFVLRFRGLSLNSSDWPYRGMLFASVGVMGIASHDGASITHGEDYLFEYAPNPVREAFGLEPKKEAIEKREVPLVELVAYSEIIQPILDSKCVQCHKADKSKGRFRMDTYELLLKGGKEGEGFVAGDAEDSNIVFRIELPEDDEEHMPPEGKTDVKEHELVLLKWWIEQGADPEKTVGELEMTDEARAAFTALQGAAALPEEVIEPEEIYAGPSDELAEQVSDFNGKYPGSLSFESQAANDLSFTAVSMRKKLEDSVVTELEPFFPYLTTVDLTATSIGDSSIEILKNATRMRSLRLGETKITDVSMKAISELKNLESLNLYGTFVTDVGAAELAGMSQLRRLFIWQTKITAEAVAKLEKANPALEVIGGMD